MHLRAELVRVVITLCLVAFILSLSNATCQLQAFARGHQLVAWTTLLVTHALALVSVEFQWSWTVTLTDAATSLYVKVEVLVGTCVAVLLTSA